jgi:hypothetical protein
MVFLRSIITATGLVAAVAVAFAVGGCGPTATKRACMGGGGQSSLITDAAMVRVDVYGPSGHCADGMLVAGAGSPILSRTYGQGAPISLDVPPGPHAIVLSTFADTDGLQLLGVGCTEADLSAGSQICFDLTLVPGPDGGEDLSGATCSTNPDDCPKGQYCDGLNCVPGCKLDSDCPKTDAGLGTCDKTTHTCEDCVADADCGTAPGAACCNKHCTNTKSDTLHCGSCTNACTGAQTQCCNSVCSNPNTDANNCGGCGTVCSTLNASMATCGGAMCSWTCSSGFAHCMAGNTGCDTNLGGSGKKLCGTTCVAATSCCSNADCMTPPAPAACYNTAGSCSGVGGSCSYTLKTGSKVCGATCCNAVNGTCNSNCTLACTAGFADCDGDPSNGCETNLNTANKKLCNGTCIDKSSCCTAADCNMPNPPVACYANPGSCPTPGGSCTYTQNPGSQICGATCCNAVNGTCTAGTCALSCTSGFFNCNGNVTDGCETACAPAHATGGCSGTSCGIGTCTSGWFDCNNSVGDGCECNTSCCTNPVTGMPGCTTGGHSDGWGHAFSDCLPLGTPGNPANYSTNLASDAAAADTTQAGTFSNGWICPRTGNNTWTFGCKCVDTGGSTGSCTSWVYTASSGNCTDLNGTSRPCTDWIGHTYKSTGSKFDSGCLCPDPGDGTYF